MQSEGGSDRCFLGSFRADILTIGHGDLTLAIRDPRDFLLMPGNVTRYWRRSHYIQNLVGQQQLLLDGLAPGSRTIRYGGSLLVQLLWLSIRMERNGFPF